MPKKNMRTRTRVAKRELGRSSTDEVSAGHSPEKDSDLASVDSLHYSSNEEELRLSGNEKTRMLAYLHEVLKQTITGRTVPFPLHVAFAEDVPLDHRGIAPPRGPGSTVGFWEWEGERYRWGIPLAHLAEGMSRLAYPDAMAFDSRECFQRSMRFELVWPGYLHQRWLVSLPLYDNLGKSIQFTKKELGRFIACQYRSFAELCTTHQITCKEPAWQIGSGGITFQDMRIATFWNITKDIWRAEITIDAPNNGWPASRWEYYSLTGAEGCYNKIIPEREDKRCPSCTTVHKTDPGLN
ncbi:hypothetical protein F5876DRAFT_78286 [Lentinula aff. lateritia]|uniref:Uncharacterized protein n=1 Tax=Lentinula aff. lateritia TaxID=2804960 RepID=A0ACC1TWF9_9AGAR|nr:hypothetical protein F5876DRAFT_78286 [Lentinula aff. lateritia]